MNDSYIHPFIGPYPMIMLLTLETSSRTDLLYQQRLLSFSEKENYDCREFLS